MAKGRKNSTHSFGASNVVASDAVNEAGVETALGFIETRGMAALQRATDAMHKGAAVDLLAYVPIGSAYVSVLSTGAVSAVKAAVAAGRAGLGACEALVGSNVIAAPHVEIMNRFTKGAYRMERPVPGEFGGALGLIETRGLAALITAHDAALKAAHVTTIGFFAVGSGLVSVVLKGGVADVRAALEAAQDAAPGPGSVHASEVIPAPHASLVRAMIEPGKGAVGSSDAPPRAIGVIETRGYSGAFLAADAGLKAADVEIECWKKIGGAMVSVMFGGDVAAVQESIEAGRRAALRVSDVLATLVIPRPHENVFTSIR